MVLDLGKSFVPPRNIVELMHLPGCCNITAKHIHGLFAVHGCNSVYDAHELLTASEKRRDAEGWYVDYQRDSAGRLSHVFWIGREQITLARCLPYSVVHKKRLGKKARCETR